MQAAQMPSRLGRVASCSCADVQTLGAIAGDRVRPSSSRLPIELFGDKYVWHAPRNEKAAGEEEER